MKMTKKLVMAAIAVASIALCGCLTEVGESGMIKGSSKSATINYTNETEETVRGMKLLATKHAALQTAIKIDEAGNGLMGIIFNKTENEDKTINFAVVGVRSMDSNQYYCSVFYNIDPEKLSESNFGCSVVKVSYDADTTTPYEIEIKKAFYDLPSTSYTSTDGDLETVITFDQDLDLGRYVVSISTDADKPALTDKKTTANAGTGTTFTIPFAACNTGWETGDEKVQAKIGYYANVKAGKTLSGSWTTTDITGNPITVEWDDSIEANPIF